MKIFRTVLEDLLAHPDLTPDDRLVYVWAYMFWPVSVRDLARMTGLSRDGTTLCCRRLASAKWMKLDRLSVAIRPVPLIPTETQNKLAQALEADYAFARNRGEYLMKRHLDMRVRCDQFVDNARPELLENPASDHPLELDRYYPQQKVAFEFNGAQHYGPTPAVDAETQKEIRTRDLLKAALSDRNGIRLIVVTSDDLRPEKIARLIPEELPQRYVDEEGPYFRTLARLSNAYASKATRGSR